MWDHICLMPVSRGQAASPTKLYPHPPHIARRHLVFIPMDACDDIDINSRRTRISITTSCISTIFLCTWVAFHPNIPGLEEPKWKVIRRRIGCMIGGILAPEIYVLLAARQFIAARAVAEAYSKEGWGLTHGFFALMGGFIIYDGKTANKIGFYDPKLECLSLDNDFGRDFTSLKAFECRLAALPLPLESPKRSSPTQGAEYFVHSLGALEYIRSNPSRFEVPFQRVRQEFDQLTIGDCIERVKFCDRVLTKKGVAPLFVIYGDHKRSGDNFLEGILIFLEAYERYTISAALGDSENIEHATTIENGDGAKELISDPISYRFIKSPRLRNLVPRINEQDIQDKSKSDILTKTIALFQVAWFILQLGARYHENLAITELEIFTLAFCVLNFSTYALWWKKPFAVDRGYVIRWRDNDWEVDVPPFVKTSPVPLSQQFGRWVGGIEFGVSSWLKTARGIIKRGFKLVTVQIARGETLVHTKGDERVSTFSPAMMRLGGRDGTVYYLAGCLLILVFGSIHFLAWSSGPTNTDKLVWRVCSICVTILPVVVFLFEPLDNNFLWENRTDLSGWTQRLASTLFYSLPTTSLFYILARIGLLVLVVRSLIFCPPSALKAVPWSQIIPHV